MTVQELVRKEELARSWRSWPELASAPSAAGLASAPSAAGLASAPNAAGMASAPSAAGLDSTQAIVKEESEDEEESEDDEDEEVSSRMRQYDYIVKLETMVVELGGNLPTRPRDF